MRDSCGSAFGLVILLTLVLFSLDAYSAFGVPLPWIGCVLSTLGCLALGWQRVSLPRVLQEESGLVGLATALCVVTLWRLGQNSFLSWQFVFLRMLTFFNFIVLIVGLKYLVEPDSLYRSFEAFNVFVVLLCFYALYVYYAQTHGMWEVPRNRPGTAGLGVAQAVRFSFPIHRALGTFREPGLLAGCLLFWYWIVDLEKRSIPRLGAKGLILATVLLSGSLLAYVGFLAVYLVRLAFYPARRALRDLAITLPICLVVFHAFAQPGLDATQGQNHLVAALFHSWNRVVDATTSGYAKTDRAHAWTYVSSKEPKFIGEGLGLANLGFAKSINANVPVSFLSLPFNVYVSGGLSCCFFMVVCLIQALTRLLSRRPTFTRVALMGVAATLSLGMVEEPNILFSIAFAVGGWDLLATAEPEG